MTFGVVWVLVAMAPVANLLFPTGVVIAERTLFLPSVGLAIGIAGAMVILQPHFAKRPRMRAGSLALGAIVLVIAGWRSAVRQPEWRDTYTVFKSTVETAPATYRAHLMFGREQRLLGKLSEAEQSFLRATELWSLDPRPFEELGQSMRIRGACGEAVPILKRAVMADSASDTARSRLIECLLVERRWDEAQLEAERGLVQGVTGYQNALARIRAGRLEIPPK
ncbi:MAG: tetratricopeptide repeat protein [Gemmatimonadales bacterium]